MEDRSVYKSAGRQEDLRRTSSRVARITVSAIKQMPSPRIKYQTPSRWARAFPRSPHPPS